MSLQLVYDRFLSLVFLCQAQNVTSIQRKVTKIVIGIFKNKNFEDNSLGT